MTGILPDTAGFGRVASKQEVASQGGGGRDGWKVHWEGERGVEEQERAGAEDLPSEPVEKHNGGPACTHHRVQKFGFRIISTKGSRHIH